MKIEDLELLKRILEGVLMASDRPLSRRELKELFEEAERPNDELLNQALAELGTDCEHRGYELQQVASGYRFQVRQELGQWVSRLWKERAPRYSRALLETLSLVAYRQPITRGEIEEIRGVAVSTQIIKTLLEREWVKVVGHRDVPGRPAIYATTKQFLDYFNLKSLDQLPPLAEIRELDSISRDFNIELPPQLAEPANDIDAGVAQASTDAEEAVLESGNDTGSASQASAEVDAEDEEPLAAFETWESGSDDSRNGNNNKTIDEPDYEGELEAQMSPRGEEDSGLNV